MYTQGKTLFARLTLLQIMAKHHMYTRGKTFMDGAHMTVLQIMAKHHMAHDKFSQLAAKLVKAAPPCMSSADDWEPTAAALEELSLTLEHGDPAAPLPDAAGMFL